MQIPNLKVSGTRLNIRETMVYFSDAPPPPPAHRISKLIHPISTRTDTTKLYDNPNDDTLSNVTSNGLDD